MRARAPARRPAGRLIHQTVTISICSCCGQIGPAESAELRLTCAKRIYILAVHAMIRKLTRSQFLVLLGIFLTGILVRFSCFGLQPFFVDAPNINAAVVTGAMRIQFPGYVPFCLVLKAMTFLTGSVFASQLLFGFLCSVTWMIYLPWFGYDRGGFPGALILMVMASFSVFSVYFSCVGASYASDFASVSGIIFHGNRMLTKNQKGHYYAALAWFAFGTLMRTLSFPFTLLGLLYLLWKDPAPKKFAVTIIALAATAAIYFGTTLSYFNGMRDLLASQRNSYGFLATLRPVWMALNLLRFIIYPIWGLSLFLLVGAGVLWRARRSLNRELLIFLLLLMGPYILVLLRDTSHAGYICLFLPWLMCVPWIAERRYWIDTKATALSAMLAPIFLAQIFLAHPVPTRGPISLVSNAYLLMYTRAGIKTSTCETLKHLAVRYHVLEKYISLSRGDHDENPY